MPFARTWSEELVAEWLQLEGFLAEVGVPIMSASGGGRREADVIGARIHESILEIQHVEVGALPGGPEHDIETIRKKFSPENEKAIEAYCRKKFGFKEEDVRVEKCYVATYASKKTQAKAIPEAIGGSSFVMLDDFVRDKVVPAIRKWKEKPPHETKIKGHYLVLPDGMWLLQVLDRFYQR